MPDVQLTWLGHASFRFDSPGGKRIYVDPWLTNPKIPESEKEHEEGRATSHVGGRYFCFQRRPRRDAVDAETGERLTDVLVFRVADQDMKDFVLADDRGVWFTTPHWNGYPAVLTRVAFLKQIDRDELEERLVEAWLTRAKKRVANDWLAAHQVSEDQTAQ